MLEILTPSIFPSDEVIGGITLKNQQLFPDGLDFKSLNNSNLEKNLLLLKTRLNIPFAAKVFYNVQVHSDKIRVVDNYSDTLALEFDGIISKNSDHLLIAKTADCPCILLFDPIQKVIAAVNSGRKGTEQNIAGAAVDGIITQFNCNAKNLIAFISPGAGFKSYFVDSHIGKLWPRKFKLDLTDQEFNNLGLTHNFNLTNNQSELQMQSFSLLDIKGRIQDQLLELGVQKQNIEISEVDTILDPKYNSFRRDYPKFATSAAYIMLK